MLWKQLELEPGVISLTGSGGKTTMAHCLASQLPGRVIFCTTTRIYPSDRLPVVTNPSLEALAAALHTHRAVCTGLPAAAGKLSAPALPMETLRSMAAYVIVEADGSHGLPLKAHLPHEPVVPSSTTRRLLLVGAAGFGLPIREAAHRPERFAALAGATLDDVATPERIAAVLQQEGGFDTVVINQVTDNLRMSQAQALAALLEVPVFAGQLREGTLVQLHDGRKKKLSQNNMI